MLIKSELRSCYCVRLGQKCFQKLILVFCFTVIWERLDLAVIIFLLENRPRTEPTRIFPTGIHWRWHSLFNICFLVGARWWHPMSGDAIVMYANTSEVIWGCAYCSRKLSNQLNQLKEFYDQISHAQTLFIPNSNAPIGWKNRWVQSNKVGFMNLTLNGLFTVQMNWQTYQKLKLRSA